jgi:hypothetical protein
MENVIKVKEAVASENELDERPKKKKKKKKYSSKYAKRSAKAEDGMLKGLNRLLRASDAGVSEWLKQRDKSAKKRKDGAQRDIVRIRAKALSKAIKKGAKIPMDIAESLPRGAGKWGAKPLKSVRPLLVDLRRARRKGRFFDPLGLL